MLPARAWVLFDSDCRFCTRLAQIARRLLDQDRFSFEALNTPWVVRRLAREDCFPEAEMGLLTTDGHYLGGPDAVRYLLAFIPGGLPLQWISSLPVLSRLFDAGYRAFARNRNCSDGTCAVAKVDRRARRIATLLWLLPLTSASCLAMLSPTLPAWGFMWLLAYTIFLVSKGATTSRALRTLRPVSMTRLLAYWLAWPGMDARRFLAAPKHAQPLRLRAWFAAVGKTLLGIVCIWILAPRLWPAHPQVTAWLGMAGTVLALHFGLFQLLALFWQSRGVDVRPIMHAPIASNSVGDFWSHRWNRAFRDLSHEMIFKPARRIFGPRFSVFLVFLVSGLLHDIIISLPAGSGYGLPTIYFLIQFAAFMFERAPMGKTLGLRLGWRGWGFAMITLTAPLPLLFHAAFLERVMLPFLTAIGALQGGQL